MKDLIEVEFTHAITGEKVVVHAAQIFARIKSMTIPGIKDPSKKATIIQANSGGVVPVSESFEDVTRLIHEAVSAFNSKGESSNGV